MRNAINALVLTSALMITIMSAFKLADIVDKKRQEKKHEKAEGAICEDREDGEDGEV